jgi:hypothetical protein
MVQGQQLSRQSSIAMKCHCKFYLPKVPLRMLPNYLENPPMNPIPLDDLVVPNPDRERANIKVVKSQPMRTLFTITNSQAYSLS